MKSWKTTAGVISSIGLNGHTWKAPVHSKEPPSCERLSALGSGRQMCFGTATIQTYHCRDRVHCISYLFSLVPMDKWKGKLKGHNLKSDRDRMQAACWKMRSKNERRKKIRGRQANKRLLLTLVSMSVTLTSLSSSTTFTMRYYIVASLRSLLCSVMTDITAWWSKSIQRTWQTTVFFALWLKTLK